MINYCKLVCRSYYLPEDSSHPVHISIYDEEESIFTYQEAYEYMHRHKIEARTEEFAKYDEPDHDEYWLVPLTDREVGIDPNEPDWIAWPQPEWAHVTCVNYPNCDEEIGCGPGEPYRMLTNKEVWEIEREAE